MEETSVGNVVSADQGEQLQQRSCEDSPALILVRKFLRTTCSEKHVGSQAMMQKTRSYRDSRLFIPIVIPDIFIQV
jgi:hypothetical protein